MVRVVQRRPGRDTSRCRTQGTKRPPKYLVVGGASRGSTAGLLLRVVIVDSINAIEYGTCMGRGWGASRRGDGDCRGIGHGDVGWRLAHPRRNKGGLEHPSLTATFIA